MTTISNTIIPLYMSKNTEALEHHNSSLLVTKSGFDSLVSQSIVTFHWFEGMLMQSG